MAQFSFLQTEWPAIFEASTKTEAAVHPDPHTACFYAAQGPDGLFTSPQVDELMSLLEDVYAHAVA